MNDTKGNQDPKLSFWQLLIGFVLLEVAIVALSALGSGCASVDPDAAYSFYTNIVVRIPGSDAAGENGTPGSDDAPEPASSTATDGKEDSGKCKSPEPPSPSVALDFRYGGFKGGKAVEDPNCQIGSLKVTSDKLTYKWVKGGCETFGASDKSDYSQTIACAFYKEGDTWVGGKFDWISTSRTSRSFENIRDGYGGWNASAFFAAKKHGFCIVSKDGKRRTNLIED